MDVFWYTAALVIGFPRPLGALDMLDTQWVRQGFLFFFFFLNPFQGFLGQLQCQRL